jgi:outer membrane protein assembly factor BamD (BamD/ComL family)
LRSLRAPVCCRLIILGAVLVAARWAGAVEVWMPETGQVTLESAPTGAEGEQYKRAVALIGAGEWDGGIAMLRKLIAANPQAEWLPQARSVLARGLVASGSYVAGFNELEALRTQYPGTSLAAQIHDLEVAAARRMARSDIDGAGKLFDRLKEQAQTPEEEALLQKQKADAFFDAEYYLEAEDEYLQLATNFRNSIWAPYAWFRMADCEWRMARWLNLGVERYQQADKEFKEYLTVYPDGANAAEAKARMVEVHRREAEKYRQVAEFYIIAEHRPWAAANYLNYLVSDYADTPQGQWAKQELDRISAPPAAPLRGRPRQLRLFGVAPVSENEQSHEPSPSR